MVFGKNFKQCRELLGINQTLVAQRTGLKQSALSRYEKGVSIPAVDTALALADSLDVRVDFLYCESISSKSIVLSRTLKKFEDQVRNLDPTKEELAILTAMLNNFIEKLNR